ncbi:universal stress protein [Ornithinimicrobium panacihumi]|uniref:universal stress protein n=1 Tax=Ornithinimicrobium panacihumi TaxID=2008449 RepID=UPI003F89A015
MNAQTSGWVVVGADGGLTDGAAVRWAAEHARRTSRPLLMVHASEPESLAARAAVAGATDITALLEAEDETSQAMAAQAERIKESYGIEVTFERHRGSPVRALLAHEDDAAVIVVGTGRKGPLREFVLGTTSLGVAAQATCPVAVINPDVDVESLTRGRIGVAIDGSPDSLTGALEAVEHAAQVGATVEAVSTWYLEMVDGYVVTEPDSPEWKHLEDGRTSMLQAAMAPALERFPDVPVEYVVRRGPVTSTLVEMAEGWDLVVLGSRGLGGVQGRLLGSVSQRLMRAAPCPVVVVTRPKL